MSTKGKDMLAVLNEAGKVFREVSSLLLSTERSMAGAKAGWESPNSYAFSYGSYDYRKPDQWFPSEVYRFYFHPKYPSVLAFVTVVLRDRDDK